jgi:hypothetical protein
LEQSKLQRHIREYSAYMESFESASWGFGAGNETYSSSQSRTKLVGGIDVYESRVLEICTKTTNSQSYRVCRTGEKHTRHYIMNLRLYSICYKSTVVGLLHRLLRYLWKGCANKWVGIDCGIMGTNRTCTSIHNAIFDTHQRVDKGEMRAYLEAEGNPNAVLAYY